MYRFTNIVLIESIFLTLLYMCSVALPQNGSEDSFFVLLLGVLVTSLIYMVYYIISEGLWEEIVGSFIVSVILSVLSVIFPPLVILLILWIVISLIGSIQSLIQLIPLGIFSAVIYGLLFAVYTSSVENGLNSPIAISCMVIYAIVTIIYSIRVSSLNRKGCLFQCAVMLASLPLIALMIYAIRASLSNLFNQTTVLRSKTVDVTQNVSGHVKANGTVVDAYTRSIPRTITEAVTYTSIGTGASTLGPTAQIISTLNTKEDNQRDRNKSEKIGNKHAVREIEFELANE